MQDGSNVQEYLRSPAAIKDADSVVLLTRKEAQKLLDDALQWRLSQLSADERFALAA